MLQCIYQEAQKAPLGPVPIDQFRKQSAPIHILGVLLASPTTPCISAAPLVPATEVSGVNRHLLQIERFG